MYKAAETEPMLGNARSPRVEKDVATGSGSVRTMRLEAPTRSCNDWFFAALFLANVAVIAVFAVWKGIPMVIHQVKAATVDDDTDEPVNPADDQDFTTVFALVMGLVGITVVVAMLWMRFLMAYAPVLIRVALWLNVVLMVGIAIASFSVQPIMSGLMLLGAAFSVCYIFAVRDRIAFASANLKTACAAVNSHLSIYLIAMFMIVKQCGWVLVWTLSALGIYQHFKDIDPMCNGTQPMETGADGQPHVGHLCGGTSAGVTLFFLLISFYWGQQVIRNVLTCSTAGMVATWWYQPQMIKTTWNAFYRSLTTSFGSICFGSLIVAILSAMRTMASLLKEKARAEENAVFACVACMAECVLNLLESAMEYFNQWAFVYVGIYGYGFRKSGKAVTELFFNRGWTAVINDDLVTSVLTLGSFGVGLLGLVIGAMMVRFSPASWFDALGSTDAAYGLLCTMGFLSGFGVSSLICNVVVTALHTVFVCFAEDPVALSRNHPHEYETLVGGWRKFHGDALTSAYGSAV